MLAYDNQCVKLQVSHKVQFSHENLTVDSYSKIHKNIN
jgi:hypothetical protein